MRALFPLLAMALLGCTRSDPSSQSTVPTAWDEPLPDRTLVDGCDPEIRPPSGRSSYDSGPVDPHQAVFGDRWPDPFFVHLGWPGRDPSTSVGILWRTDPDTLASKAEITPVGGGDTLTVEGASFLFGDSYEAGTGDYRMHEIRLCSGLEPGTTYTYRVGGEGHWSPEYQFTTPGAPGTFDAFRVVVLGDSRGSYEQFGHILARADAHDPDFFVFSGDMVDTGTRQDEWDAWFAASGDIFAGKVVVPTHGNHEVLASHYFAHFAFPNNEEWFDLQYGDLHLISLNDTVRDLSHVDEQAAWLDQQLAQTDSGWQAMVHHRTMYSTCLTHGSNTALRAAWGPVLDDHGVDLVFAGHNHIYERSVPVKAEAEVGPGEGTTYFVTGGAGAPLYTSAEFDWFAAAVAKTEHYLVLDFGPSGIRGTAYDPADNVLDEFVIPR